MIGAIFNRHAPKKGHAEHEKIMSCVRQGKVRGLRRLIEIGVDINTTDELKNTPLHIAVMFRQKDIASLLVKHGADIHAKNHLGKTPMDYTRTPGLRPRLSRKPQPNDDSVRHAMLAVHSMLLRP